jgi:hypothetical protein
MNGKENGEVIKPVVKIAAANIILGSARGRGGDVIFARLHSIQRRFIVDIRIPPLFN